MPPTAGTISLLNPRSFCLEDAIFDIGWAKRLWKPAIRKIVVGSARPHIMRPGESILQAPLKRLGLYLHVPFCSNLCPFCPYNRVKYQPDLYRRYEQAVHQEIDLVQEGLALTEAARPPITSLYIGGGTPTVDPEGLVRIVRHLTDAFGRPDDICVELHPEAMDEACLDRLQEAGVGMISIGVESLSDRLLSLIGRSHDARTAEDAVRRAARRGFQSVNADLMFALPTQSPEEVDHDVRRVLELGVDQVSTYPLFGFPYSERGQEGKLRRIERPPGNTIRAMLHVIKTRALEAGLKRCAVWSFIGPSKKKFSSITRHHYLGFGPSAASMTGRQFYVNTFSVEDYADALPRRLPVALVLPLEKRLEMGYWLYWRAYEMKVPPGEFQELFGAPVEQVFGGLFLALRTFGMIARENGHYRITEKAAYWIHRLQNEYSLNYINRLWGTCRSTPWPDRVVF